MVRTDSSKLALTPGEKESDFAEIDQEFFGHDGLNELYKRSRTTSPKASSNYIKISDKDIEECFPKELHAETLGESKPETKTKIPNLSQINKSLASRSDYTVTEVAEVPAIAAVEGNEMIGLTIDGLISDPHTYKELIKAKIPISLFRDIKASEEFKKLIIYSGRTIEGSNFDSDLLLCELEAQHKTVANDKVAIRQLASGFFIQPDYLDGRYVGQYDQYKFEIVSPIKLLEAIPKSFFDSRHTTAVFETDSFFLIRYQEKITVVPRYVRPGQIDSRLAIEDINNEQKLINAIFGMVDDSPMQSAQEAVQSLFQKYQDKGIRFVCNVDINEDHSERMDYSELVDLLISAREPVYIKGSKSSGGSSIVKLGFDSDGNPTIESSSEGINDLIHVIIDKAQSTFDEFNSGNDDLNNQSAYVHSLIKEHRKNVYNKSRLSVRKILSELISNIEYPIIEREIPFETLNNARVEFRVICQSGLGSQTPTVVAHYCKESTDPIAANISIAGKGSVSSEVMQGLVKQRCPNLSDDDIELKAQKLLSGLIKSVNDFTPHYFEHKGLESFAVDLVPVWNPESQDFEFWLLEVQDKFGFSGLKEIDPEMAGKVEDRLRQLKDNN